MLLSPRSHQTRESPSSMTLSLPMFDLKGGTSTISESRNVFAVPAPPGLIPLLIMKGSRSSAPVSEDYQRIISFLRSRLLSCQGPHLLCAWNRGLPSDLTTNETPRSHRASASILLLVSYSAMASFPRVRRRNCGLDWSEKYTLSFRRYIVHTFV